MKALRLAELKELLTGQAFGAWWAEYSRLLSALKDVRAQHEDLLAHAEMMELRSDLSQRAAIDAFSRSGESEDQGRSEAAQAQSSENRALELVAVFEEHRFKTSDLWYRLGGAEKRLDERREALRGAVDGPKMKAQAEAALREAEREHARARDEYGGADKQREALWNEVEEAWSKSLEKALLSAERGVLARTIKREAERQFKEAEERRMQSKELRAEADAAGRARAEAEKKKEEILRAAEEKFECMAGDGWLYWRHRDDNRSAFAVALADLPEGTNLEVKALAIYTVGLERGIDFLEPSRDGLQATAEEGDRRLEEFLLGPSKGTATS